jgi:hypothetical protein
LGLFHARTFFIYLYENLQLMEIQDAIALAQEMIGTRSQNPYYERVCRLTDEYKALTTGENAEILLKQFVRREDNESFRQRLALTIFITPAIVSSLMKPFNKVSWNKKVKKYFEFDTDARNRTVEKMRDSFYGRKKSKNKGLDYWLKVRYPALSFIDPNAWLVIEWDAPASQAEPIQPRPFEVSSHNAWDWLVENEETKWLWVHQDIAVNRMVKTQGINKAQRIANGIYSTESGDKWTLYDTDYTLVYTEVDPEYLKSIGYVAAPNETFWRDPITKKNFSVKQYEPKLGFAPCFRVGYIADPETDSATFVNGWHEATPYLMKSVKTVSEMDLTMALHVFPQKMQYVQACPGYAVPNGKPRRCNMGKDDEGNTCPACKGAGYKVHTSAQDALFFKFPEQGTTNAEVLDLEKLLVYKHPPTEILEFQFKYIASLEDSCRNAVFAKTQLTKTTAGTGPVTATETNVNSASVNEALHPFTEKVSDTWIEIIYTFGVLAGMPPSEDPNITCVFPANPNMKSLEELLADLKTANDSGAPPFLKDAINNDIAEIVYEGDDVGERMYWTKHQFYPFNGQTSEEVALAMASQYVSKFTKVLYSNFESIFNDIDLENVGFWFMTLEEQWPIVEAMVNEYIVDIEQDTIPDIPLGNPPSFPDNTPAPPAPGEQTLNPGDPGYVDPNEAA